MKRFEVHPNFVIKEIKGKYLIRDVESKDIYVSFGFDDIAEAQKWCNIFNRWCQV